MALLLPGIGRGGREAFSGAHYRQAHGGCGWHCGRRGGAGRRQQAALTFTFPSANFPGESRAHASAPCLQRWRVLLAPSFRDVSG